jgi:hypothetical protein
MHNHTDVCTSNCLCDPTGTHQCIEKTGTCQCKFPHVGKYCVGCAKGYVKDPQSGQCHKMGKCKDQGGEVDCAGHGVCQQIGETAKCICDSGFANDGHK